MSAAALSKGCTLIQNAAMEPEVIALAGFLNAMGAKIEGAGTSTITVTGVERLHGCTYRVPSDRIQAGTYLLAAAMTLGDITVKGVIPEHQSPLLSKLREMGCEVVEGNDWIRVTATARPKASRVKTLPYPGFPTDMQQPMAALMAISDGASVIDEQIYEGRIGHVQELNRMGASITQRGQTSIIEGVEKLSGAAVKASDLRAGAALVLAGLAAEGETVVSNIHFIDRGYERLAETMRSLGADMERVRTTARTS
jgi:UDP-N-acetylglucosamine 1-carboxyvinyltransferase